MIDDALETPLGVDHQHKLVAPRQRARDGAHPRRIVGAEELEDGDVRRLFDARYLPH